MASFAAMDSRTSTSDAAEECFVSSEEGLLPPPRHLLNVRCDSLLLRRRRCLRPTAMDACVDAQQFKATCHTAAGQERLQLKPVLWRVRVRGRRTRMDP